MSPSACPAPRTVTRLTGSACGDRTPTSACPASWTATVASSPGASGLVCRRAEQHAVAGVGEVGGGQYGTAGPDRGQGGLVDQVGQVRARKARGGGGDLVEVGVWAEVLAAGMRVQDGPPFGPAGQRDDDLAVEPAGPRSAGSSASGRLVAASTTTPPDSSNPSISASSWLRVCSRSSLPREAAVVAAGAEGIDLVDEHDRRCAGAGLLEQVPDPGRPHADEHLHEARARDGEEGDVGFARDRAGEQRPSRCRAARPSARRAAPRARPGGSGRGRAGSERPR